MHRDDRQFMLGLVVAAVIGAGIAIELKIIASYFVWPY